MRLLLSGTCSPGLNSNYGLIEEIYEGFQAIPDNVASVETKLVQIFELIDAINEWKPAIILLIGGLALETIPLFLIKDLAELAGSSLIFWSLEDPYEIDHVLSKGSIFDIIFTTDFSSSLFYPGDWNIHHLPMASPFKRYSSNNIAQYNLNRWFFCGVPFANRVSYLRSLAKLEPHGTIIGPGWLDFPLETFLYRKRISNRILREFYSLMPLTIYLGREHNLNNKSCIIPSTPGPRLFECAGSSGLQVFCSSALEIEQYYEPGREILQSSNFSDTAELIQWIMCEPLKAEQIKKNAWKRTQNEHLYVHRAEKIIKICLDNLA